MYCLTLRKTCDLLATLRRANYSDPIIKSIFKRKVASTFVDNGVNVTFMNEVTPLKKYLVSISANGIIDTGV